MPTSRPFEQLIEIAAEQHGFLRIADAEAIGIKPVYLRKLALQGRLQHRARGLYRLTAIPTTDRDEFQEAVMMGPIGGVIAGDAAIALWNLADVNSRVIEVIIPPGTQVRRKNPGSIAFRQHFLPQRDITIVDNIQVLTPDIAIRALITAGSDGELVLQAIQNARKRDLIGELTEARLRVALADRAELSGTAS